MTKAEKKLHQAISLIMTPQLEACFEAGSAEQLRPLLATWTEEELNKLHHDLHVAYDFAMSALDDRYRRALRDGGFLPEVETLYNHHRTGLNEVFVEIHQELGFYLDKRKGTIQ